MCANGCEVSTVAFAFSVMVVIYTVQDGRSNYLEGAMVSCCLFSSTAWWLIRALASWSLLHHRPRVLRQPLPPGTRRLIPIAGPYGLSHMSLATTDTQ